VYIFISRDDQARASPLFLPPPPDQLIVLPSCVSKAKGDASRSTRSAVRAFDVITTSVINVHTRLSRVD